MDHNPEHSPSLLIAEWADLLGNHPLTFNRHTASQFFQYSRWRMAVDQRFVFLLQFIARMGDTKGDIAIIGEQQQPGGLAVKPSDGNHSLPDVDQIHHRSPTTFITRCGDVTRRLVQQNVASLFRS